MKGYNCKKLCLIFLVLFCLFLNSCKSPENIIQRTSDVDFSSPKNMQVSYNEYIYNISLSLNEKTLLIEFIDGENLLCGANIQLTENNYQINYNDIIFCGDKSQLINSFLPCVIYDFIFSFEDKIILNSYDKEKACFFIKKEVNGFFVTLECYETENDKFYSMEIK